jgi:hypothetical protein
MMKKALLMLFLVVPSRLLGDEPLACHSFGVNEIRDTQEYWKMERRKEASPAALLTLSPAQLLSIRKDKSFKRRGRKQAKGAAITSASSFLVSKPESAIVTDPPFAAAGKLFFINSTRRWCSASFTGDPKILLTAAHCVRSTNGSYFSGIFFVRASVDDAGEEFSIERVITRPEWVTSGDRDQFDYAFLRTTLPVTSVAPLNFETGSPKSWIAVGYPDKYFEGSVPRTPNGMTMMYAAGKGSNVSGMILMEGIPLNHGVSGGPWIPPPNAPFGSTVVSVASTIGPDDDSLLGPIFDERVAQLFEFIKVCR